MTQAELPHGQSTENAPQINVATKYGRWYTPATTYVDTAEIVDAQNIQVSWVVKDNMVDPSQRPSVVGDIAVDGTTVRNSFVVDGTPPRHTDDHFNELVGVNLFPGFMGMGGIIAAASHEQPMLVTGLRAIKYLSAAFPGDKVTAVLQQQTSGATTVVNGRVLVNDDAERIHTFARDLQFTPAPERDPTRNALEQHQEFEVVAQMAGSVVWAYNENLSADVFPVFLGIGAMKREPTVVYAGDLLRGAVTLKAMDEKGCTVDVLQTVNGVELALYENVRLGFLSKEWFMENVVNKRNSS